MNKFNELKALDKEYVMETYAPFDVAFVEGDGCYLFDINGKKYLDFLSGIAVCSLGYKNASYAAHLTEQASRLTVTSNYFYNEFRGPLAKALVEGTNLSKAFFCNSGAEANECALKLSRKYFYDKGLDKYKILALDYSFHGRTLATVSLTGQPKYSKPYSPLPEGLNLHVQANDIKALEQGLSDKNVGALIIELIQGESGVYALNKEYVKKARELTKKNGQLLIIDEVQTGCGRTGKFWAFEHFGVEPDILTSAKGIGGGFPIGACLATSEVAASFKPGDHGTTFGGSPLACSVALNVVNTIKNDAFLQNIISIGDYFKSCLATIGKPVIEVRGLGLMLGVKLDNTVNSKEIVKEMLNRGFVINTCGDNILRFLPALIIEKSHIDQMITTLKDVLYASKTV